ncbi:DNA polymerase III, partial [Streptomyces sp. JJ36]|nr:DNA polymerase III [Streptomyces sp. JJ36]
MKSAITDETRLAREELVARSVAAGLNVMASVSRHTSALVTSDHDAGTAKAVGARSHGVPLLTEDAFLALLADVHPGTAHATPAAATTVPPPRRTRPV